MHNTTDKKRAFSDVFGELQWMESCLMLSVRRVVTQFLYNKISKHVEIHMELPEVVQMNRIYSLEKALCSHFNAGVKVIPCFSIKNDNKDIPKICRENFIEVIAGKSAHFRYLLENAIFEVEDQKLNIHLKTGGSMILQSGNCNKVLEDYIRTYFRKEIKVCFKDPPLDEKERERYFKEKSSIEQKQLKRLSAILPGREEKGGQGIRQYCFI